MAECLQLAFDTGGKRVTLPIVSGVDIPTIPASYAPTSTPASTQSRLMRWLMRWGWSERSTAARKLLRRGHTDDHAMRADARSDSGQRVSVGAQPGRFPPRVPPLGGQAVAAALPLAERDARRWPTGGAPYRGDDIPTPELIQSPLSQAITRDGHTLKVDIYRLEDETEWLLEVVNKYGTSHVWDDRFATDQAALDAVHATIDEEGIGAFLD
ncbi:hypothetical protein OCT48_14685 [Halomonas sp. M4R1S46]|nr:hypothetical protein OCT48_14685 [Halomonas sp. M4R1S46]